MKIVFLFIDGVGLRDPAPDNPVNPEVCPTLCRLIGRHSVPIDANLIVDGLPQSATGQATMFTGVNAPVFMGRHCEGFPGPSDECHNYKNVTIDTNICALGINTEGSKKCDDMMNKVHYIQKEHNGGGVIFASGTPEMGRLA